MENHFAKVEITRGTMENKSILNLTHGTHAVDQMSAALEGLSARSYSVYGHTLVMKDLRKFSPWNIIFTDSRKFSPSKDSCYTV